MNSFNSLVDDHASHRAFIAQALIMAVLMLVGTVAVVALACSVLTHG